MKLDKRVCLVLCLLVFLLAGFVALVLHTDSHIHDAISIFKQSGHSTLNFHIVELQKASIMSVYFSITFAIVTAVGIAICIVAIQRSSMQNQRDRLKAMDRESRYLEMIDSSGVILFTTDRSGNFTFASTRSKDLTGYDINEIIGKPFTFLVQPGWRNQLFHLYNKQVEDKTPETFVEFPILTKGKQQKWVNQSAILLKNGEQHEGFQCIVRDITEKKKAENRLKASDQKIRAMLANTLDGIYMLDTNLKFTLLNDVARNTLREFCGSDAKIGANALDVVSPQYHSRYSKLFRLALHGRIREIEMNFPTPVGERWFNTTCFPVKNEEGHIIGVCATMRDVTEKKAAFRVIEQEREEKEKIRHRLQAILDNTPLLVFEKDIEGHYMFVNKSFKDTLRLNDKDIIGKTDFDFDTPLNAEKYRIDDQQIINTLQNSENEERIVIGDRERILRIFKCPLFDKNGELYGIGGIATDITEKVLHQEKLVAAKQQAEAAEQLQEQFLANMSHEIRTPMNGIIGMANLLQETNLDSGQQEFLNIIRQSSDQLLMLINQILDISKIKAGKVVVEKIDFALDEELETIIAPFRIKAREKKLILSLKNELQQKLILSGDKLKLRQALTNLISNAIKFTEEGHVRIEIKERSRTENTIAIDFAVSDTGIGIPTGKLEQVFESFVQADSGITRKYGGSGLGLSITRQLIELQGGHISASNNAEKGCCFSFTLEYEISMQTPVNERPSIVTVPDYSELAGRRVLIVEDNEINQRVINTYLQKAAIRTMVANNGREAVEILEKDPNFDLVIMDLQMPEMNGLQATAYIRKRLQLCLPIVAMTASALRNEKMKCFEAGMNEYMTKPFVPAELFKLLRRLMLNRNQTTPLIEFNRLNQNYYDLSYLRSMQDAVNERDVLQVFLSTTPVLLEEIKTEALFENWERVHKKAHKLKSSLAILQMSELLEICTHIETQSRDRSDLEKIPQQVNQLLQKFSVIQPLISAEMDQCSHVNQES